ncbi:MAG: hypothetical protein RH949_20935 [Coleofasciculus sp. A1-SPW-01]|uniref:hypothetical protein n=1 Tax=Coleofasciculus sp. A1-SPW-01 TaxID=3070819 RepID=UPI0033018125
MARLYNSSFVLIDVSTAIHLGVTKKIVVKPAPTQSPQLPLLHRIYEAVLIDFGIAREFSPNITQTHTQSLSEGFAPIEQYDWRSKRGAYTDVYALAATLYALLTGEIPLPAPMRAYRLELEPPQQLNPKISDRFGLTVQKQIWQSILDKQKSHWQAWC